MTNENIRQRPHPIYRGGMNQVTSTYGNTVDGTHYVMWSGGCDSTLLLYELIDAYGPENVVAISYKYPWLLNSKRQSEVMYRDAFKAKMKLRGKKYEIQRHLEFTIDIQEVSGPYENVSAMGLPQAVAWMLSIPLYAKENSYIYTGAIRSDDLTLVLEGYYQMFEGISKTLDKNLKLREPYLYLNKSDIIDKLFQYGIYNETWFCEIPKEIGTVCCECVPCRTHISALTELSMHASNEFISMQAKDALQKIENIRQNMKDQQSNTIAEVDNHDNKKFPNKL